MTHDTPKAIMIMAPHSSSWDLVIGLAIHGATKLELNWMGKQELFWGPFGRLLRSFGGVPLNREATKDLVASVTGEFRSRERFFLGVAPEGSRSYRPYWRSGFYHMALSAQVPVICYYIDYKTKKGGCGPLIHLTGDVEKDLDAIRRFYEGITPKNPQNVGPIRFKD
jgi:1-acyl-sn-glycerol-3-phosphate acyltransferase